GSKQTEAAKKSQKWAEELEKVRAGMDSIQDSHPDLYAYLKPAERRKEDQRPNGPRANPVSTAPFMNAVFDGGLWVDGSDPDLTIIDVKSGTPRDLPVLVRGSVSNPGDPAPRHFLTVLSKSDPAFHSGSGRLELADKIFSDAAPL